MSLSMFRIIESIHLSPTRDKSEALESLWVVESYVLSKIGITAMEAMVGSLLSRLVLFWIVAKTGGVNKLNFEVDVFGREDWDFDDFGEGRLESLYVARCEGSARGYFFIYLSWSNFKSSNCRSRDICLENLGDLISNT